MISVLVPSEWTVLLQDNYASNNLNAHPHLQTYNSLLNLHHLIPHHNVYNTEREGNIEIHVIRL